MSVYIPVCCSTPGCGLWFETLEALAGSGCRCPACVEEDAARERDRKRAAKAAVERDAIKIRNRVAAARADLGPSCEGADA